MFILYSSKLDNKVIEALAMYCTTSHHLYGCEWRERASVLELVNELETKDQNSNHSGMVKVRIFRVKSGPHKGRLIENKFGTGFTTTLVWKKL